MEENKELETKAIYQSKTVIGIAVMGIVLCIKTFTDYDVDVVANEQLTVIVQGMAGLVGAVLGLVGRLKATKKIG